MSFEMLYSKIHRATVQQVELDYEGSITIPRELMKKADIYEFQKVQVVNLNNGQRFETYVIRGEDLNCICVNGAAARLVSVGDKIIIMAFRIIEKAGRETHKPIIIKVNEKNDII